MEVPRHWRLRAVRYRLVGAVCPACGALVFLPRPACPNCSELRNQTPARAILVLPAWEAIASPESRIAAASLKEA